MLNLYTHWFVKISEISPTLEKILKNYMYEKPYATFCLSSFPFSSFFSLLKIQVFRQSFGKKRNLPLN